MKSLSLNEESSTGYKRMANPGFQSSLDYLAAHITEHKDKSGELQTRQAFVFDAFSRNNSDSSRDKGEPEFLLSGLKSKGRSERKQESKSEKKELHTEKLELPEKILKSAESKRGAELWRPDYVKITQNGDLGCAVAVSKVLKEAGVSIRVYEGVWDLERYLTKTLGWTKHPLQDAEPGDVAVGHKSTDSSKNHIGIISRTGGVWNNSARNSNTWANESLLTGIRPAWLFNGYDNRYVLRPPKK